ncbi:MAG: guanylate kinase [Candidatus Omnitrophota bacterium]
MAANKTQKIPGKVFVLSGPSGSGKTTLLSGLIQDSKLKDKLLKSVSLTTRPKRPQELSGKDYFFVKKQRFLDMLKAKKILEWTRYLGYYYGTPKQLVDRKLKLGKSIGFCLDIKGARALKRIYPKQAVTIFVKPPSISTLKKRIESRSACADKAETSKRLALARKELRAAAGFDHIILNTELAQAKKQLINIITSEITNRHR